MNAFSLERMVEGLAYGDSGRRNWSGSIDSQEKFFENLPKLTALHSGVFCFLAFHPRLDLAVASYVEKGSLASDAGPDIMALFLSARSFPMPRPVTGRDLDLGVVLDGGEHPAYQFVGWLFPADRRPALPGLVVFDRLFEVFDSVYIPLAGLDKAAAVAQRCRDVFTTVEFVLHQAKPVYELNFNKFCSALDRAGIPYERTGSQSLFTWLRPVVAWTKKHGGELVAAVLKRALAG